MENSVKVFSSYTKGESYRADFRTPEQAVSEFNRLVKLLKGHIEKGAVAVIIRYWQGALMQMEEIRG